MTETTPVTPDTQDTVTNGSFTASSIGATLRAAREQKGLTVADIHARLRISERQIHAIETDDFSLLPEPTITRGFIRNYAKFLEMDAEPLLAAYRAQTPSEEQKNISIPSANIPISQSRTTDWKKYIYASVLVLLGAGVWLLYDENLIPKIPDFHLGNTSTEVTPAKEETLPQAALPAAEREAAALPAQGEAFALPPEQVSEPASAAPAAESQVPAAPTPAASATPQPATAQPATTPQPAPAATPAPSAPSSAAAPSAAVAMHKVRLVFTEDSWVSIIDRHGKEIFNKTKRAGSEDAVEGEPPLKVTIGNAAGSQLIYDDKPVDTTPYNRLNVVRITLE
ncbi:MAG TPA: RodZ domain-containing protein [Methylovorus sp.]|jgi:cytoskeleton protein RodZ|nr:RodZ domain-containing protein [Methylovorus sp.]